MTLFECLVSPHSFSLLPCLAVPFISFFPLLVVGGQRALGSRDPVCCVRSAMCPQMSIEQMRWLKTKQNRISPSLHTTVVQARCVEWFLLEGGCELDVGCGKAWGWGFSPRTLGPTHKAGLWVQRSKRSSTMGDVVSINGWVGGLPVVREQYLPPSGHDFAALIGSGHPEISAVWLSLIRLSLNVTMSLDNFDECMSRFHRFPKWGNWWSQLSPWVRSGKWVSELNYTFCPVPRLKALPLRDVLFKRKKVS